MSGCLQLAQSYLPSDSKCVSLYANRKPSGVVDKKLGECDEKRKHTEIVTVNSSSKDSERFENVEMYAEKTSILSVMLLANVKRAAIVLPWKGRKEG